MNRVFYSQRTQGTIDVNKRFKEKAKRPGIPFQYLRQELHPAAAAVLYAIKISAWGDKFHPRVFFLLQSLKIDII
jgi:hypothetical protein